MLFHGDGSTNITNADSLNHYGVLVDWSLIQDFLAEFPEKFEITKKKIEQKRLLEKMKDVEEYSSQFLNLSRTEEVDTSSPQVEALINSINHLIEIHQEVPLSWWPIIEDLRNLKDYPSVNEIMKFQWAGINSDIKNGFDLVMTNPPFGRSKNLKIDDPKILCQYKLATELFIEDATISQCKKIIKNLKLPIDTGGKTAGEIKEEIRIKSEQEWFTILDIEGCDSKLTLKDGRGYEHTIYYDSKGHPIVFKKQLPKQVLFLEQFLRIVKPGGKIFTVIDTGVLSNKEDEYVRRFIYRNAKVHAIVEFPHKAFKAGGTDVKTAVVLYEKTNAPPKNYDIFGSLPQNLGYVLNKKDTPPDPDNNDLGMTLCDWRYKLGIGRNCDPCKKMKFENLAEEGSNCTWYHDGFCWVWREKIEKVEVA
jgi:hypothetical protein